MRQSAKAFRWWDKIAPFFQPPAEIRSERGYSTSVTVKSLRSVLRTQES